MTKTWYMYVMIKRRRSIHVFIPRPRPQRYFVAFLCLGSVTSYYVNLHIFGYRQKLSTNFFMWAVDPNSRVEWKSNETTFRPAFILWPMIIGPVLRKHNLQPSVGWLLKLHDHSQNLTVWRLVSCRCLLKWPWWKARTIEVESYNWLRWSEGWCSTVPVHGRWKNHQCGVYKNKARPI